MPDPMLVSMTILVISAAFFGEALYGFGGGLVAIPLLSLFLGVRDAVILTLFFQLLFGLLILRVHHEVDWKSIKPVLPGLVLGTFLGTVSLSFFPDSILRFILGGLILLYLLKEIRLRSFTISNPARIWIASLFGFFSGWLQGAIGSGGPPLVVYLSELRLEKTAFRASIIAFLFAANILRVVFSGSLGLFNQHVLTAAIPVLPFFLLALWAGQHYHPAIPEKYYRSAIYVVLFLSALTLLLKG